MTEKETHLLIVEDEEALREAYAEGLSDRGYTVTQVETGEQALVKLREFAFDVVVTDLKLPGAADGTQVVKAAVERYPKILVIVMTAHEAAFPEVKKAVETMPNGKGTFLTKPFLFEHLVHVLSKELATQNEIDDLRRQVNERYQFGNLVGCSRVMRNLVDLLKTVAPTNSTVLITGETGTGKELAARAIHQNSPRHAHRFVAINCGAIPETLLEAELFGHVRGAFTGAIESRPGRIEQAQKGTLFLDEISTMSTALQGKLLRVLQERELERIGDTRQIKIDVRVVAATNSDLTQRVADGDFREDLFYRLNVIPVTLPPLRDRREDVPLLTEHFLQRIGRELVPPRPQVKPTQEARQQLSAYHWPGNVRQLENVIERALTLNQGRSQIEIGDLPQEIQAAPNSLENFQVTVPDEGLDFSLSIHDIERQIIRQALEKSGGNKRRAADLLKLKRTTLIEKMKRLYT
ncbi:MAG: sigma-54 dependent transcriptional regulator [Vicinamibacterales bacterium]|jgi:DNA-binding NtrC family response regulator|nr:DNA-binding response regulator [Acidobacteriota bacterium]MDP7210462.1 sigma-54 dependent transcriptional regulator [Vicinamibacterales bacterium]HJO16843.1 sigma-54 dependent transcriptional regulator [Vicinamibacterales bacterium]|tara:strand:- start:138334 stop:139725 length:1392 start_codon:yes stop_codon:yes gene_type:complete